MENQTITTKNSRMKTWKIVSLIMLHLTIVSIQLYGLIFAACYLYNTLDVILNVKPVAQEIDKAVKDGQAKPEELDKLVAYGIEPRAIEYWRKNYLH